VARLHKLEQAAAQLARDAATATKVLVQTALQVSAGKWLQACWLWVKVSATPENSAAFFAKQLAI